MKESQSNLQVFFTFRSLNIRDISTMAGFVLAHTNNPLVPLSILWTGFGRRNTLMTPGVGGVNTHGKQDFTHCRPYPEPFVEKTTTPSGLLTMAQWSSW